MATNEHAANLSTLESGVTVVDSNVLNVQSIVSGSALSLDALILSLLGDASSLLGIPSIGVGYKSGGRYVTTSASETVVFSAIKRGFLFVQADGDAALSSTGVVRVYDGAQDASHLIVSAQIAAGSSQVVCCYPYQSILYPIVTAQSDGTNEVRLSIGLYSNELGGVISIQTGEDTELRKLNPTTNYATATSLYVGRGAIASDLARTLLQFDLSSLPSSTAVGRAILQFKVATGSGDACTLSIHRMIRNWVVDQATWNEYSTGNAWTVAGMEAGVDYQTIAEYSGVTDFADGGVYQFDVTGCVQAWIAGMSVNNGFALIARDDVAATKFSIYSLNHATTAYKPALLIYPI